MRYFFDLYDDMVVIDDLGQEFDDLEEARRQAVTILAEVAAEVLPADGPAKRMTVLVREGADSVVFTVTLDLLVRHGNHLSV